MENEGIISGLLLSALDDLSLDDFKRFKDKLSYAAFEDKGFIPHGQLEIADRIDTKNLLKAFYPGTAAVDVTINALTQINRRDCAAKLRVECETALGPQQTPEPSANAYRVKYREHILNQYCTIKDMNARIGENVKLNSRYTKLIIINEHRHKKEKEKEREIMASGQRYAELMTEHASPITISDLFKFYENQSSPQVVVLQGAAGIGKTLTAQKIMLDWANGELYESKFDYVFYINCREINFVSELGSVEDLILKNCPDQNAPTKEILRCPGKLLFIIDGFDEMSFSFNHSKSHFSSDLCGKQPMEITVSSLLRRRVLPQSYLLITTRPTALETLNQCLEKSCTYAEILGFSEKERKEYFDKFFRNEEQAKKAFTFVKDNEMLFTMCFAPIACWIICTVLKQQMEAGEDLAQTSTTITDVYMFFLFSLLKHHSTSKQEVQDNIKGLCSLAAAGIWRQKILFEEDDVKEHGLDKPNSLFLNENMFQKIIDCEYLYSFIHLSFQEFFAALFYVLEKEERVKISENAIQPVDKLFEKWEQSRNYLMFTVRFLFGLSNKDRLKKLQKELSCKTSPNIKNNLVTWIKEKLWSFSSCNQMPSEDTIFFLEYFHCLYEIKETEFVQSSMNHLTELKLTQLTLTKMDQVVVSFCIKNSSNLESVEIIFCGFLTEDLTDDSPGPCKLPERAEPQLEPHRSPIYSLCEALKDSKCKLKNLRFYYCRLRDSCYKDIAAALRTNQDLIKLDLSGNTLGDRGMHLLCEGLKQNCKLESLKLRSCDLRDSCCEDLSAALRTIRSLKELDLGRNYLSDPGVQLLCEGLKQNWKLESLNLRNCYDNHCGITAAGCGDLAALLKTNWSLTKLDLGRHELGNTGVQLLFEELTHPNCKLEALWLNCCGLTSACSEALSSVLMTSQTLTYLDILGLTLTDSGLQHLYEGLMHQNCKLLKLRMEYHYLIPERRDQLDVLRMGVSGFHILWWSEEE